MCELYQFMVPGFFVDHVVIELVCSVQFIKSLNNITLRAGEMCIAELEVSSLTGVRQLYSRGTVRVFRCVEFTDSTSSIVHKVVGLHVRSQYSGFYGIKCS